MSPSKAPSPDGFNAGFFQRTWNITGKTVLKFMKDLQQGDGMPPGVAEALLELIPKVESPSRIREFRSISLCNVIYKLFMKVIANRLKGVQSHLISNNQERFIAG